MSPRSTSSRPSPSTSPAPATYRSPPGSFWDDTLKVWDLALGRALHALRGPSDGVSAVAVTSDGQRAVSGSDDDTLKVWDLLSGCELRTLHGHSTHVTAVAVTPDGQR